MYSMKPVFELSTAFTHTSSMYKLKNIQLNTFRTYLDSKTETISSENSLMENDEKMVLSRQEKLLNELSKLKEQLDAFRSEVHKLQSSVCQNLKTAAAVSPKIDYSQLLSDAAIQDIVINVNPNSPPYSLLGLSKLWNDLPISVTVHSHSSVANIPQELSKFRILEKKPRTTKFINVTLVWKNVDDCELIASPVRNKIILGEVNVLRLFYNYIVVNESAAVQNAIDTLLDTAHQLNYASGQEKGILIKDLSSTLGNNDWFTESKKLTVADLGIWSALVKSNKKDRLPQNVTKWLQKCSSAIGVSV